MDMVIDNNKLQIVQYSQEKFSPGVTKFIYSLPAFTQPDKTGENTESYLPTYKSMTIKPKSFSLLPMSKLQFLDHRGFHAPRCLFYTFISFFEHYPPSLFPIYNYAFYL